MPGSERGFRVSFEGDLLAVSEPKSMSRGGSITNVSIVDDEGSVMEFFCFGDDELVNAELKKLQKYDRIAGSATIRQGQYGRISARLLSVRKAGTRAAAGATS